MSKEVIITTQRTSKKWKGLGCLSGLIFMVGAGMAVLGMAAEDAGIKSAASGSGPDASFVLMLIAAVIWVIARIGKWWTND